MGKEEAIIETKEVKEVKDPKTEPAEALKVVEPLESAAETLGGVTFNKKTDEEFTRRGRPPKFRFISEEKKEEKPVEPVKTVEPVESVKPVEPVTVVEKEEIAISQWEERIAQLQTENEELKKAKENPYKIPEFYKLQKIKEETPEEFDLYMGLVYGKPDSEKIWKIGFLKDNPEYSDKPDVVQRIFERKFPNLFLQPEEDEDDEKIRIRNYQDAQIDLDLEAKKIKKTLLGRLETIEVPLATDKKEEEKKKTDKLVNEWKLPFTQLARELSKKQLKFQLADKSEFEGELVIPEESKEEIFKRAAIMVLHQGLPFSEENLSKVSDFIWREVRADYSEPQFQDILQNAISKRDSEWGVKVNNPGVIKSTHIPKGEIMTEDDKQRDFISKVHGAQK